MVLHRNKKVRWQRKEANHLVVMRCADHRTLYMSEELSQSSTCVGKQHAKKF